MFNNAVLMQSSAPGFVNLKSVIFGGVDEFVNFGDINNFERTDTFSPSFWFKTTTSSTEMIITRQANDGVFPGWNIFIEAGKLKFTLINNTATSNRIFKETTGTFNDNNWHNAVLTYSGTSAASGLLMYVDGAEVTTNTLTDALSGSILAAGVNFQVSGRDGANVVFVGSVDEVAIYDKVLTAVEVSDIYNSGNPPDLALLSSAGDRLHWWRMGDDDTFPTLTDNVGVADGTMTNMEAGDIQSDTP